MLQQLPVHIIEWSLRQQEEERIEPVLSPEEVALTLKVKKIKRTHYNKMYQRACRARRKIERRDYLKKQRLIATTEEKARREELRMIPRGANFQNGKYNAVIEIARRRYHLGRFNKKEEAEAKFRKVFIEWYGKVPW